MDVRIETAPMTAESTMLSTVVRAITNVCQKTFALVERVVSFSCPDFGSIAANAPNEILKGELARAA